MFIARPQNPEIPPAQCLTVAQLREWVRSGGNADEDAQLAELLLSAMDFAETYCHQPLFARNFFGYDSDFEGGQLHSLNVLAVTAVHYQTDTNVTWQLLNATAYRYTETGEIFFAPSARQIPEVVVRVRVSYRAGYEASALPYDILQVMKLMVSTWYDTRTDEKRVSPSTLDLFLRPHMLPI